MKTTYITFTREMAIAYREKRKRMTRRVSKFQPPSDARHVSFRFNLRNGRWECHFMDSNRRLGGVGVKCPYGQPGDQLIFGTTWAVHKCYDHLKPTELPIEEGCDIEHSYEVKPIELWSDFDCDEKPKWCGRLRPGRFLPGFLRDRMPLETIKNIRVERVQSITEDDALLEGMPANPYYMADGTIDKAMSISARDNFEMLWDRINGKRGFPWDNNPWVWVLEW